ncbi:hypothetical protein EON67_11035 [archaeon]|nr:MAG: hypothetical protein EON67_11035 [archaeon]
MTACSISSRGATACPACLLVVRACNVPPHHPCTTNGACVRYACMGGNALCTHARTCVCVCV